ncbi:Lrp/AsnC family transcriptional regulator [Oceanisphaera psychrotolerans]|uniref:AsnC family transcriptional regulator n=1 Tax=Oceanisphaera psychrotolerans TaxID=1414654 RepID=A0A1J4QEV6_9GAMM|nr:Lrp/AsnC family transcriptional regulator [Oceanisphaera psychrotolerans]OIN12315.1 AsnC family transcriptional regulator [Oceanisphaera psychrotolerans]
MTSKVDNFDRAILSILQKDNTTPLRLVAEQVHLSTASVQRRIKRMEESGVIKKNSAIVSPEKVGNIITIIVEVHVVHAHASYMKDMKKIFSGPEIQQCYYVTGEADFMLILTVSDMAEYEAISSRLFYNNENVKWFRTIVVIDRVKATMDTPLPTLSPS